MTKLDAKRDPAVRAAIVTVLEAGLAVNDGLTQVFAHQDGTYVYRDPTRAAWGESHVPDAPGTSTTFHSPDLAADAFIMDLSDD